MTMTNLSQNSSKLTRMMGLTSVSTSCLLALSACQQPTADFNTLSGETMGTSYHISYQLPDGTNEAAIQASIY